LNPLRTERLEVLVSYLTELLAGYRQGLARDLTESTEALQAALEDENDPASRGNVLGLLAQSLVRQDRQLLTIDEPKSMRLPVTKESPAMSPGAGLSATGSGSWSCLILSLMALPPGFARLVPA
jgi:hypothetical protein